MADRVLGIERTSRRLVPQLRREHFAVSYFDGGHTVPAEALDRAVTLLGETPSGR